MKRSLRGRFALILTVALCAVLAGGASRVVQDQCGPFTDVTPGFCPYILEIYYLGITVGTSATTFSPDEPLTRGQGAVFVAKGINQTLARSSRRAALGQWWTTTPHDDLGLGVTAVPGFSTEVACDGADVWVSSLLGTITRIRASDGKVLDSWTGASNAREILVAMGRVFAVDSDLGDPGVLYMIDPSQPSGAVTVAATGFGSTLTGLAFDGSRLWTSHQGGVSIITPGASLPWSVTTTAVGPNGLSGIVFDGANMWVTDATAGTLMKLDANAAIVQTVPVGGLPNHMLFDGANLWILNNTFGGPTTITVVQASSGAVLTSLSGNGLTVPLEAAFDGERVLVSNAGESVSLWRAADLSPIGTASFTIGSEPTGVCSDGLNFWVSLAGVNQLARF